MTCCVDWHRWTRLANRDEDMRRIKKQNTEPHQHKSSELLIGDPQVEVMELINRGQNPDNNTVDYI